MVEELPMELKKPRCHSMMVDNGEKKQNFEEEDNINKGNDKNGQSFFEEEEEKEIENSSIKKQNEPFFKPKDAMQSWQSYEKDRICKNFSLILV